MEFFKTQKCKSYDVSYVSQCNTLIFSKIVWSNRLFLFFFQVSTVYVLAYHLLLFSFLISTKAVLPCIILYVSAVAKRLVWVSIETKKPYPIATVQEGAEEAVEGALNLLGCLTGTRWVPKRRQNNHIHRDMAASVMHQNIEQRS